MNRNESFPALTVSALNVRLGWANLEIMVDDVEDIQVLLSGDEGEIAEMKLTLQEGRLQVEQPSYGISTRIHNSKWMQVVVRLPRGWKGSVDASSVTGSVNVRGVTGTDLNLDTVSGDVLAHDLSGESLSLRTVSGKVRLEGAGFVSYRLNDVSGDVALTLSDAFERLDGVTVSGNVSITAPITRADASLRAISGRLLTEGVSIGSGAPRVAMSSVSANVQLICSLKQTDETNL